MDDHLIFSSGVLGIVETVEPVENQARLDRPILASPGPAVRGIDFGMAPPLTGYVVTVAKARAVSTSQINALVSKYTKGRDLGFLGAPRVNVLQLNLALDGQYPAK